MEKKYNIKMFCSVLAAILYLSEAMGQRVMSDSILEQYESYQRPKRTFRFSHKRNVDALKALEVLPVDTNAVYVSTTFFSQQNATYYRYTRFFGGGEVFLSHEYKSPPSDQECNDLTYGTWGMYSVTGDKLIIEIYVRGFPSRYCYNYAKYETGKLHFYKRVEGRFLKDSISIDITESLEQVHLTNRAVIWK